MNNKRMWLLPHLLFLLHTFYALEVNQNYPGIRKDGIDANADTLKSNLGNFDVGPGEERKDMATRAAMVRQWRESLRAWQRSLEKERAVSKEKKNLKAAQRGTRLQGKRVKADLKKATNKKKNEKLKPQQRTFFKSSEPEPHYDHYDIFGYPGDHYYPHFMDYDDIHDYDYDKDDVDHGNFFVDQFHDLLDFFF